MTTPRVFIIRHGETEWSLNGRHTGISDIPLTSNGEKRIRATGRALVGADRLIVPHHLAHIYVSPRQRAQRTLELLGLGCTAADLPWRRHGDLAAPNVGGVEEGGGGGGEVGPARGSSATIEVAEAVREWDYGDYEGVTSEEIQAQRRRDGRPEWDIWRDGCPNGEYARRCRRRRPRAPCHADFQCRARVR